jgi:hypothetical protein
MNLYLQQRERRRSSGLSIRPDHSIRRQSADFETLLDSLSLGSRYQPPANERLVLMPESTLCFIWDIASVSLLLYQAFELPLVFCFEVTLPMLIVGLDFCVVIFFLLDIRNSVTQLYLSIELCTLRASW